MAVARVQELQRGVGGVIETAQILEQRTKKRTREQTTLESRITPPAAIAKVSKYL